MAKIKKEVATRRFNCVAVYPCIELDKSSESIPSRLAKEIEKTLNCIGINAAAAPLLFDPRTLSLPDVHDWLKIVAQQILQSDDDELAIWTSMIVSAERQYCFGSDTSFHDATEFFSGIQQAGNDMPFESPTRAYAGDFYQVCRKNESDELNIDVIHHLNVEQSFAFCLRQFEAEYEKALKAVYSFRNTVDSIVESQEQLGHKISTAIEAAIPRSAHY